MLAAAGDGGGGDGVDSGWLVGGGRDGVDTG